MRLNQEYMGKLECKALAGDLIVGFPNTIECVYTVGKYGIDDGGHIKIIRQGVTDWQHIQTDRPEDWGYTTVKTTGKADLRIESSTESVRPYENGICIKVSNSCMYEGEQIILTMGDTSHGSPGILTQTVKERAHKIIGLVDVYGGNLYRQLMPITYLPVKNGTCAKIDLLLPSLCEIDKTFTAKIRIVDMYGNRCDGFRGSVKINPPDNFICPHLIDFKGDEGGCAEIECKITKAGDYRAKISIPNYDLKSESNVCKVAKEQEYKLFWGDMHGQNAVGGGLGDMEDSLRFTKQIGCLDFTGWQGNDFEVSDENWATVCEAIKRYNKNHEFITFLGYEWSGVHSTGGDHNIYYLNDDESIHRSSQWYYRNPKTLASDGREDDGSDCNPISELWDRFRGRKDVMAIPHVGGRYGNFDFYDPDMIPVIEIHSHHGIFDWFLEDAMKREMKVGFIATSDDHTTRMGLSYPMGANSDDFGSTFDVKSGLTAVYAKELTREGIWEAIKNRRCYAATNSRTIVKFSLNGAFMGEEIETTKAPTMDFQIDADSSVDRVEIYRNTEKIKTLYAHNINMDEKVKHVKVVWSGVKTKFRKKSVRWDGKLFIHNGRIANAKNYSVDHEFDGIKYFNNQIVQFASKTAGDEDGMILDVIPLEGEKCTLRFASNQIDNTIELDRLSEEAIEVNTGLMNCKVAFSLECDATEDTKHFEGTFTDENIKAGHNAYYIKVFMKDGNRAWSSPVFVQCTK